MRETRSTEEVLEQLKQYLGCPCTYFPPMKDDNPIVDSYRQAQSRGRENGFIPVLVTVDELLCECFEINCEGGKKPEEVRQELLATPLSSGKELLQNRLCEMKADLEQSDPDCWEQRLGEEDGGQAIDRFQGYWDYGTKKTSPLVLAEIPVKHPWEVFAYLPFGGWNDCPCNEEHMAVAKYWFETYGAIPAVMTHDVLEYDLPTPMPEEKAMTVAMEQYAYCSDIVDQGVETIGRLAGCLAQSTVWFFWWD